MVSEKHRLDYLHRMGIRSYVPKSQLPGAMPSIRLVPTGQSANTPAVVAKGRPAPTSQSIGHSIDSVKALLRRDDQDATAKSKNNATESPIPPETSTGSKPSEDSFSITVKSSSNRTTDQSDHRETIEKPFAPTEIHCISFRYGGLTIICELVNSNEIFTLPSTHRILITDAIRLVTGSFDAELLHEREIHWPLPGRRITVNSTEAISDLLVGLLDADPPGFIVCFGEVLKSIAHSYPSLHAPTLSELVSNADLRTTLADRLIAEASRNL